MDTKQIYLSPRNLLKYLCALDNNIQKKDNSLYQGDAFEAPVTTESLNKEAGKMLLFAGLGYVTPVCRFAETDKSMAGYISDARKFSNQIHITVSEKYINDPLAIRATLAHEICHRVVYIHSLDKEDDSIHNEIMTDLCTIYIGFGKLIKEGYLGQKFKLGYLEFPMYLHACHIMNLMGRNYNFIKRSDIENDIFLSETTDHWNETEDKTTFIRQIMIREEKEMAEEQRKILALINLLQQAYTKNASKMREVSARLEKCGEMKKGGKVNALQTFRHVYEWHVENPNQPKEEKPKEEKRFLSSMDAFILDLIEDNANVDLDNLGYHIAKCPACGHEVSKNEWVGSNKLTRCEKCGITYLSSHTRLNVIGMRKNRALEHERLRNERYALNKLREDAETLYSRAKNAESNVRKLKDKHIDEGYQKGYNAGVGKLANMVSDNFSRLPGWLKWLLKRNNWPESFQ